MTDHLGDDAELYALGLMPERRDAIEAHLASCAACRALVIDAEAAAAALAVTLPAAPLPRRPSVPVAALATAAAVVFAAAAAFEGVAATRAQAEIARIDTGLAVVARSHFDHISFTATARGAPVAKAIYGKDRRWVEVVIVDGRPLRAVATGPSGEVDLGAAQAAGGVATLYRALPAAFTTLDLRDGSMTVARAVLPP